LSLFTETQKARIKHFLGYPAWEANANGIQLGIPAGTHALYLVEQSFERLGAGGVASVLSDLKECEEIEKQMGCARQRGRAKRLGDLEPNPDELRMLRGDLERWASIMANDLGCPLNPYAPNAVGGSGINARVVG
jgi:hypothetical protein